MSKLQDKADARRAKLQKARHRRQGKSKVQMSRKEALEHAAKRLGRRLRMRP